MRHRSSQAQTDLTAIRSRDVLVKSRTQMINHVRGLVKANGERLPKCSTASFAKKCEPLVPPELRSALDAVFQTHVWDVDCCPGRQKRQETGGGGSGSEIVCVAASVVDDPR